MGFCPQASPPEDVPCLLSRPLWGPKAPLTLIARTQGKLPHPAPLGVAGASLDGQQMEQLPALSSLPGLTSQTKTRKEWGRWASGQASPRTHKGRNVPQRKSPGPLPYRTVPLGPRTTKERRKPPWARPSPWPSVRSPCCLLIASSAGRWMPEIPPSGPVRCDCKVLSAATAQGQRAAPWALCAGTF